MNHWTQLSIDFANQRDYLDQLFTVYPLTVGLRREIVDKKWKRVEFAFYEQDNEEPF